jgi:hypothetical protein
MPVAPHSSFPVPTEVDLDFRPDRYIADWCALAAVAQNVTGEARRAAVARGLLGSVRLRASQLVDVPPRPLSAQLLSDRLPPARRAHWVADDPLARVSGEYLPAYLPSEVEIARLVLDTRPMIVYSVRAAAMPTARGSSRTVRVVDEHGTTFTHHAEPEAQPYSLRALIRLIDGVRSSTLPEHPEHLPFPEALLLEGVALGVPSGQLHDFVQVSSTVYPELLAFYRARLRWWVRQHFAVGPRSRYVRSTWADNLGRWWREGAR